MEGERAHFGTLLKRAREAKGIPRERLARELNLSLGVLEDLESGRWEALPPGRERPLARQVAERLGVDPSGHVEAWSDIPGEPEPELVEPGQERMEQVVMAALGLGSVALVVWLVMPGPRLRRPPARGSLAPALGPPAAAPLPPQSQPYPVLGEALPEAPVTEEGVLVLLRAMDRGEARVVAEGLDQRRTLQVSEPWKLRVKGAFRLELDNAGVVAVQVAGKPIRHGQSVGESWVGQFSPEGAWIRPAPPNEAPATVPDTIPEPGDP